jgi:hypothetical protein
MRIVKRSEVMASSAWRTLGASVANGSVNLPILA